VATSGRDLLRHPLSLLGAALATITGSLVLALFLASLAGYEGNPYLGMVTYVVFPSLLVVGLLLIPAGAVLERRRLVKLAQSGGVEPPLPIIDLNSPRTRRVGLVFLGLTTVNLLLIGAASYKGLEVMDSPEFCGSCHSVMDPEASAHARSPHARVRCVECHIGPGASWFVKSKLAGSWQLVSVMLDLYPKPIPTPVQALRPARDTCEQCHWPAKFVGDRFKVITHHADDAASTPLKTVLLIHVGGTQGATTHGIHWHVDKGVKLRYQADERREKIGAIELTTADGKQRRWEAAGPPAAAGAAWRDMDCIDCHNRPTHVYRTAEDEVDAALLAGRLDRRLPFLRREAVKALRVAYATREAAAAGLRDGLRSFYASQPAAGADRGALVDAAAAELAAIWGRNVWPQMKIGWGTYPTLLGHEQSPGCFRCHDGEHATADGKVISNDCDLCHSLLAQDDKDPAILKQLVP
jgi:nitrate/TMAO reductase-like tetraheme cytochrome c subunit